MKFRKLLEKMATSMAAFMTVIAVSNAASACCWILHQPEEPEELSK